MDKTEARAVIKYLPKKGMTSKEIYDDIVQIIAEDSFSYITVKRSTEEFKQSRNNAKIYLLSGYPQKLTTDEKVDAIHCMILDDRRLILQQIAKFWGINSGPVHTV